MTVAALQSLRLHGKLAEVMAEVERIPKRGKAPPAMGGYAFVQVGDAADAIRKALAERSVSMIPSIVEVLGESEHETKSGGTMTTQTLRVTWTLTDGITGETATIQSLGTGADTGDKFSPKAQTNAMKYALLMGFLLSTGDDPEAADLPERGAKNEARSQGAYARARAEREARPEMERSDEPERMTLSGTVAAGKSAPVDMLARQSPDGTLWGFVLVSETHGRTQVVATGTLADDIWDALMHDAANLFAKVVTVTGLMERVPWQKDGKDMPPYKRLVLESLRTPEWTLPDAPVEAESVPLFEGPEAA